MRIHCYIFTVASEKIWVILWFLFFVSSLIPISPQRQNHSEHQRHATKTDKQTNYCVFYIYQCPVHLWLQNLKHNLLE